MNLTKILLILVVLIISVDGYGQSITWHKTYIDNNIQYGFSIVQTSDTGYIVVGKHNFNTIVLRLNKYGDTIWTKIFSGNNGGKIIKSNDGNFVIAGFYHYAFKIDINGILLWIINYMDSSSYNFTAKNIIQTYDNGYAIVGWTDSNLAYRTFPHIKKININGTKLWEKTYGQNIYDGYISDIINDSANSLVFTGQYVNSPPLFYKMYIMKTDDIGNQINFFSYDSIFHPIAMVLANDNSYVITGIDNFNIGLRNIYRNGNLQWSYKFDSTNIATFPEPRSIIKTLDGGYAITGLWDSTGNYDFWTRLIKVNFNGILEFKKSYGYDGNDEGNQIIQCYDSGYAIVGTRYRYNNDDIFVVKTDKYGNAPLSPIGIIKNKLNIPHEFILHQNYPNPFNPSTTIKYKVPKEGNIKFRVYDIAGREIVNIELYRQAGEYNYQFDGSKLSSGVYFYQIEFGDNICVKKMILIK